MEKNTLILGLVIALVTLIAIIIGIFLYKKRKIANEHFVRETSQRYFELKQLKNEYLFCENINVRYIFTKQVSSKVKFDRFRLDDYFQTVIDENENEFLQIIERVKKNQNLMLLYTEALKRVAEYTTKDEAKSYGISPKKYRKIEIRICEEEILKPVTDTSFVCEVRYSSPQGRKNYRDVRNYSIADFYDYQQLVVEHRLEVERAKQYKESNEYQRRIMTSSLRYNILQRDGFRCQLCGRNTKDDGVKLHVDHIIPVSKGGKTIESNLRTLCEACNLGKRDKYDPSGVN